jgi:hypothetical protein
VRELSGFEEYQMICAALGRDTPTAVAAAPEPQQDRWPRVVALVLASIVVVVIGLALALKPDPIERARDEVTQTEQDVTELRMKRDTFGEGGAGWPSPEYLDRQIAEAEAELESERAELRELEREEE